MSKLFAIGLEVEEVAVGKVLRTLDTMPGVARIHLKLSGHKNGEIAEGAEQAALPAPHRHIRPNTINPNRGRCDQAVADALKDGERPLKELAAYIGRRGFAPMSLSSMINTMQAEGYVKRIGVGLWQLTSAGYRHFHKGQAKSQPVSTKSNGRKKTGYQIDNSKGARRIVLDFLREGPKSAAEVTNELKRRGLSPKNMSGTVYKMKLGSQAMVASKDGIYSLTTIGRDEIDRITANQSQAAE